MQKFKKIVIGFFFSVFFFLFIILSTAYFQLFNQSYLFSIFQKYQVYEKIPLLLATSLPHDPNLSEEDGKEYADIARYVSPDLVKRIVEENIAQFLIFVDGKSDDIVLSFPADEIGIPEAENITWSLSSNPVLREKVAVFHNLRSKILIILFIVIIILIGLFFFYRRVTANPKIDTGAVLLLINGILLLLISGIGKFFFIQMARDLPNAPEPSQKLLGLLAGSLFPEITTLWVIIGSVCSVLFFIMKLGVKIRRN